MFHLDGFTKGQKGPILLVSVRAAGNNHPRAVIPIDQSPYSCIYKPSCPFSLQSQILSSCGKAPLYFCVSQKMLFLLPDCLTWPYPCSVLALAKSQGACELTYFLSVEESASEIWYPSDVCVNELLPAILLRGFVISSFHHVCILFFQVSLPSQTWQPYTQFQWVTSLTK